MVCTRLHAESQEPHVAREFGHACPTAHQTSAICSRLSAGRRLVTAYLQPFLPFPVFRGATLVAPLAGKRDG